MGKMEEMQISFACTLESLAHWSPTQTPLDWDTVETEIKTSICL